MIGVGKVVRRVYEIRVSELSRPMVHSKTTTDRQKDVIELVRLLHGDNLFTNKPGRKHVSFSDMEVNLFKNIVPTNFKARLKRLVKEMAEKEAVVKQMQAEYPANLSSIYLGVLIQYLPDMYKRKQLMAISTIYIYICFGLEC